MQQMERLQQFLAPAILKENTTVVKVDFLNCDPNLKEVPLTLILPCLPVLLSIRNLENDRMIFFGEVNVFQIVVNVPPKTQLRIHWNET